jgi:hypothetical protein
MYQPGFAIYITLDMSYCPNCEATVAADAKSCAACRAVFDGEGWEPLATKPVKSEGKSASGIIVTLGIASVVVPLAGFVIGLVLSLIIPGCHCDEGAGCSGCGANGLIAFLLLGGFVGALFSLLTILPGSLALAGIVRLFKRW